MGSYLRRKVSRPWAGGRGVDGAVRWPRARAARGALRLRFVAGVTPPTARHKVAAAGGGEGVTQEVNG